MKNALIFATVAVLALLAWFLWPPAAVEPRPAAGGATADPSAPAPAATASHESLPSDTAPELLRQPVDRPAGPTGARVTVVWANDGEPAAAIPVLVYRAEGRGSVLVATVATDTAGVVTFAELTAGEHSFRAVPAVR